MKKRVYFNEFNLPMDKTVYLPFVSGILQAYSQTFPELNDAFEFMPFIFLRDTPENILKKYDNPSVAAFSVCIWNHQLSLAVAKLVKEKFPSCQIVFGGPQVCADDREKYPFIDHIVLEEGEKKFVKWLGSLIGADIKCDHHTLDDFPSPYTAGLFDQTIKDHPDLNFQAIVEIVRGCPFACGFCYWGNFFDDNKIRRHNLDYVRAEADWIGRQQIKYVFCIAEDSMVDTIDGLIPIQNVNSGNYVWGWDEDAERVVLNQVGQVCCTGVKPVFRIEHGSGYIEATEDHRILTRRGWIEAGEITPGDEVLSRLRQAVAKIEPEVLFTKLSLESRGAEGRQPGYRQIQGGGQESGCDESEKRKGGEQASRNSTGKERGEIYRSREDCSRQKDCQWDGGRASEEDQSGSSGQVERIVQGRQELDEKNELGRAKAKRSCREGIGDAASTGLLLAEGRQTSTLGVKGLAGKYEEVLERSRMVCQTFFESRGTSKQIRERANQPLRGEESAVSVHRRPDLVAGALPIGRLQEPRFYSQGEGSQESDTRSRAILAPRFRGGAGGDRGLQECWLGSIFDLGRRCVGSGDGEQDLPVCWVTVTSVKAVGEKRVYDLINAVPSHNFFANGILVSNCADANFGMFDRDQDVARIYVEAKQKYSYPEKLRVCYGKNREEAVYKTAKILSSAGLAKAITLARQSNDAQVLKNIERSNIKLSVYESLQERYHVDGIPTYTEIILGLPGETVETFKKGIADIMGTATQLFIYHCSILPNTEMAKHEYIAKHGIKTVRVPLAEIHCAVRKPEHVVEYEDIIIQTNSMTQAEWMECCVFSWEMQLKQSFGADVTPEEHARFVEIAEEITRGASRGQVDRRFGDIYWEPEELAFMRIALKNGMISGDTRDWAKEVILYGRKSRVHQPPLGA